MVILYNRTTLVYIKNFLDFYPLGSLKNIHHISKAACSHSATSLGTMDNWALCF